MIVCSCNVITSQAIKQTIQQANGCCRLSDVYGNLGCQPQCGRCAPTIAQMIRASAQPLENHCGTDVQSAEALLELA